MASAVLLIGAGRMGGALLEGWLRQANRDIVVVDPSPNPKIRRLCKSRKVALHNDLASVPAAEFAACLVALKPQVLATEAVRLRDVAGHGALMISIAAGTSIARMKKAWGRRARIIRAMPNTPGAIGCGITALYADPAATRKDCVLAETLLSALGGTVWLGREALIDAATAVSGSGPAYLFLFAEALAEAAMAEGLPREISDHLARATIAGAGALLTSSARKASDLRKDVTSPGGTTEAALKVLMGSKGLTPLVRRAVKAAHHRARVLARQR